VVLRRAPVVVVVAVILNLGCGNRPKAGAVNVDRAPAPGVELVHDLDVMPWPWADGEVAEIHAAHLFEHVADPIGFMCEAWRILELGGLLHIEVPHYLSRNAFTDPTHRRFCTEETFLYWCAGSWLYEMSAAYHPAGETFEQIGCTVAGGDLVVDLRRS
jgi:hypothetical protein